MKNSMKFKGCEFRLRPRFNHLEFEVEGTQGHAIGKLTVGECLELGKYLMDAYYSRTLRAAADAQDAKVEE